MRGIGGFSGGLIAATALLVAALPACARPAEHLMLMFSEPKADKADYDRWYDEVHAPAIVAVDGFVDAQRADAEADTGGLGFAPPRRFMVRYTLATDDLRSSFAHVPGPDPAHPPPVAAGGFALVFDAAGPMRHGGRARIFTPGAAANTYELYILENARAGRDADMARWYDRHHLREMLAVPGFVGARRYVRSPVQRDRSGPSPHYLTVYRLATDRIDLLLSGLEQRHGRFTPTDTIDDAGKQRFLYRLTGPLVRRAAGAARRDKRGT